MMLADGIKALIVKKFGSAAEFCRAAGMPLQKYKDTMNIRGRITEKRHKRLRELLERARSTRPRIDPEVLTKVKRRQLSVAIKTRYKNVARFSKKHPEFPAPSVYAILNGYRKRITPKVKALFDALGVDI